MDLLFLLKLTINIIFLFMLFTSGVLIGCWFVLNFIALSRNIADWAGDRSEWRFYSLKTTSRLIFRNIIKK